MDAARIAVIWTELKEYSDETQLGFPLSTIKVGELAELISENAGYRHISKRFDLLRLERDALQENVDRFLQERDAALAEVERLTKERVIFTARSVIVTEDEAREMFPDSDPKQQASD